MSTALTLEQGLTLQELQIRDRVMNATLDEVVLERFEERTNTPREKTKNLEQELKKFIAISAIAPGTRPFMFSVEVDELWHIFVLFTEKYETFCKTYAGKFIHHYPCSKQERESKTMTDFIREYSKFSRLYERVFHEKPESTIWDPKTELKCRPSCNSC